MLGRSCLLLMSMAVMLPAEATTLPATKPLYSATRERLLEFLGDKTSFPTTISRKGEAWLLVSLGPTRLDFFGMALPQSRARKFAMACDEGLNRSGFPGVKIAFSEEKGVAVVDTDKDYPRFGSLQASARVDLATLRSVLASRGFKAKVVVQTREYAVTHGLGEIVEGRGHWRYGDGSSAGVVTTEESLSPWQVVAIFIGAVWPGAIVGSAILLATGIAKNERMPRERRQALYRSIILGSLVPAIGLHLPLFAWLYGSGLIHRASDLWFGTPGMTSLFGLGMMITLSLLGLVGRKVQRFEYELFQKPFPSATERALTLRGKIRSFVAGLGVCAPFVIVGFIGYQLYKDPNVLVGSLLLGAMAMVLVFSAFEKSRLKDEATRIRPNTSAE